MERLKDLNLEIIGLSSVATSKELKGLGIVDDTVKKFLKNKWEDPQPGSYLRIALLHHNILPPFSANPLEESGHIINAGEIVERLTSYGCNIILSGHCHDSYLYNFSISSLTRKGFSSMKNICYLSTGTSGAYAPTKDRSRSFNVLNIFSSLEQDTEVNLVVQPYFYDSRSQIWDDGEKLKTVIRK
jgi:hypothetical protein